MAENSDTKVVPATVRLVPKVSDEWSPTEQQSHIVHHHAQDPCSDSWCLEIYALILSITCVFAMSMILRRFDGRPNPELMRGLTLNALVSILGTTSKVALMYVISNSLSQLKWVWFLGREPRALLDAEVFDAASRGPLGSLIMLSTRTRKSIATFGAILTLLAVAYDPFLQQVTTFKTYYKFELEPGHDIELTRARMFLLKGSSETGRQTRQAGFWFDPSGGSFKDFDWQPGCYTGNCTWPSFETLMWTSQCFQDTNWTVSPQCSIATTARYAMDLPLGVPQQLNCSVSTGNSLYRTSQKIDWPLSYTVLNYSTDGDSYSISASLSGSSLVVRPLYSMFGQLVPGNWTTAPVLSVGTFKLNFNDDGSANVSTKTCELDIIAAQCHMEVDNDNTNLTLLNSQSLQKRTCRTFSLTNGSAHDVFRVYLRPTSPSNMTLFKDLDMPPEDVPSEVMNNTTQECDKYCSQAAAFFNWTASLTKMLDFKGNMSFSTLQSGRDDSVRLFDASFTKRHFGSNLSGDDYDDLAYQWYYWGPYTVMRRMAASMTKATLSSAKNVGGVDSIFGYASSPKTLVEVRWVWLIMPVGLCLAGTIFFMTTVYVSRQAGAPLWKSSINALFYHGIDFDWGIWRPLSTISEMDTQAMNTKVKLVPVGLQKRLVLEKQE